jgi:hypothetical protein
VTLDKEKIEKYLSNGARPTTRVVKLLQDAKIKLPKWVKLPKTDALKLTRNPNKLRKNQPQEEPVNEEAENVETEAKAVVETPVSPEELAETETPADEAKEEEVNND